MSTEDIFVERCKQAHDRLCEGGDDKVCSLCGKAAEELSCPLSRCSICRVVSYCGKECQTNDWKIHKKECANFKKMKGNIKIQRKEWSKDFGIPKRKLKSDLALHNEIWNKTAVAVSMLARVVNFSGVKVSNKTGIAQDEQNCHFVYSIQEPSVRIFPSSPFPEVQRTFIVEVTEVHEYCNSNSADIARIGLGKMTPQDGAVYTMDGCAMMPMIARRIYFDASPEAMVEAPIASKTAGHSSSSGPESREYQRLYNRLVAELVVPQMASFKTPRAMPPHLPVEEMWKRLSRDTRFHETVRGKPFGVIASKRRLKKGSTSTMFFVNAPVIEKHFAWAENRIQREIEKLHLEGAPTKASSAASFSTGDNVEVVGLQNSPHLNHRVGMVAGGLLSNGRYPVLLDGKKTAIKPDNLKQECSNGSMVEKIRAVSKTLLHDGKSTKTKKA